jgi:hypothetical protein
VSRVRCVWVHEEAVLSTNGKHIAYWEVWAAHNTRKDAMDDLQHEFNIRPSWVTAEFHRMTNRIRKYIPEIR